MSDSSDSRSGFFRRLVIAAVLMGLVLRFAQWLGDASFWLDEANLAENLVYSGLMDLIKKPLRWAQVAPVGFLVLEKAAMKVFGPGEMAFRILPFVGSILCLVAFWALARRLLKDAGVFLAIGVFALNPLLISIGGALKQYSTDVMVTVLLLLVAVFLLEERPWEGDMGENRKARRWWYGAAAGAGFLGFLSIPSILIAGPALLALLYRDRAVGFRDRTWWRARGLPLSLWGGLAGVSALREKWMLSQEWAGFMTGYWDQKGAFLPPFTEDPLALFDVLRAGLFRGLLFRPYVGAEISHGPLVDTQFTTVGLLLLGVVGVAGFFRLRGRRGFEWSLLVLGPFVLAILLSRLEVYPLDPRTSAFLLPLAALFFGWGLDLMTSARVTRSRWSRVLIAGVVLLPFVKVLTDHPPPYQIAPVRELMKDLAERREPSDPVYGFWYSDAFFGYYGRRFGIWEGTKAATGGDLRANVRELVEFRGRESLWVLFPHSYGHEKNVALCFLGAVGRETDQVYRRLPGRPRSVSLHRFDLSDIERFDSVDPERYSTAPEDFIGTWPSCVVPASPEFSPSF